MNILMVTADYLPNIGGIAAHVFHVSHAMQTMGHTVTIANPIASRRDEIEVTEEDGLTTYRIHYAKLRHPRRLWVRTPATLRGLRHVLDDVGPVDVLHQHDHVASTLAVNLLPKRATWIWTNHTSNFLGHFRQPLKRRMVQLAYRRFDGIIAVSDELYAKSRQVWGGRLPIDYIPNGVDTRLFHPRVTVDRAAYGLAPEDFVVLCPRRMVPKNGVIYLAHAVNRLVTERPDVPWRFVFLGSDPTVNTDAAYIAEVRAVLEQAPRSDAITYLGNLPMAQMPGLNALADVVVMPSLMEAVSLSALEAMATRKPLVATRVGGLPEIVHPDETGLLVPPRDPDALAQAILRLIESPDLRARIAEGGYRLATEQYSWQRIAERTLDFYERVRAR